MRLWDAQKLTFMLHFASEVHGARRWQGVQCAMLARCCVGY